MRLFKYLFSSFATKKRAKQQYKAHPNQKNSIPKIIGKSVN
jgi:hypothetical protein